jgi:hypothetical protein
MTGGLVFALFYCVGYLAVSLLSVRFFSGSLSVRVASLRSMAILSALIIGVFVVALSVPDAELGNRFQHAVGGGVLGVVLCYLVFRDHRIKATRFQFFIWTALIVTALGVGNELLEFVVQSEGSFVFANNVFDTWRDLASNSVGIALAAPFAALARR